MFLGISALLVILFEFVVGTVGALLFLLWAPSLCFSPGRCRISSGRFVNIFFSNNKKLQLFIDVH